MFEIPSAGGSNYFTPSEHLRSLCIVLEPKQFKRDQPHTYQGKASTRNVAVCDMAIFETSEDIENATPSKVLKGVNVTATILAADIDEKGWIGKTVLAVVRQPGQAYVWREPEYPGAHEAAAKWYSEREAEKKSNLDDFPLDD